MLSFFALWFIDTVLLIAAAPHMEGWALVSVIALHGAVTFEGMSYYNRKISERLTGKGQRYG